MKYWSLVLAVVAFFGSHCLSAQISVDCGNAVPICSNTPVNGGTQGYGIDDFNGALSSGCLEQTVTGAIESNSAWYRFRTGASGQLGFNIGFDTSEDWDFALYRASDCNNLGDPVRCNFFDNQDQEAFMGVGEDPSGNTNSYLYEDWLQVTAGEDYYLFINNFSNSNSGFSIQFSGQIFETNPHDALDCSIINNLLGPPLAACDSETVILDATTTGAISYSWYNDLGSGYQLISGQTSATLHVTQSAMYRVEIVTSGANIISDVQVAFTTAPITFALNDEVVCSDITNFDLSTKDAEALGTQSSSEYVVSYHSSSADATSGLNALTVDHLVNPGSETIFVRTTSSANPNCFDASTSFQLTVVETPPIDFQTEVFICEASNGVAIGPASSNPHFSYLWDTGETTSSIFVSQAGTYSLTITNNQAGLSCTTDADITLVVSETPRISEVIIDDLQADNRVEILTDVVGEFEYRLDNGEYQPSNVFTNVAPGMHSVSINDLGGCGTVTETITVVGFPKFFTPNGDGSNDEWNIVGMSTLENPVVQVFDRYGKLLKQFTGDSPGWDGTFLGRQLPATDYWFKLTYTDMNGQVVEAKYLSNHFSLRR
ncbi:T9SS type B sorting domain-containing protein [Poritiphilus flavus]|uniref:T9SS type B sorting domain-containing protein n=1 Tax=Poritiphilus flavus TaxID=2697053 RepID=A0A6L9E904_9FLAO|nr:T9SS type B sorting domain-containing protein [Poritiphilus flavus]NAS11093.1 T9SS type B sorting domain-containing protein [Poritiphilus flavus]